MGVGKLPIQPHFGQAFGISLPYTAQTDGFLICVLNNTNGASGGYNLIDSSDGLHYRVNSFQGYQERGYFPVRKGATLTQGLSGSVTTPYYYFLPIVGT